MPENGCFSVQMFDSAVAHRCCTKLRRKLRDRRHLEARLHGYLRAVGPPLLTPNSHFKLGLRREIGNLMTLAAESIDPPVEDPVSNVLKWILLGVAVATFGLLAWATVMTYRTAPPQPERFVSPDATVLMTDQDIVAGKGGFQKADLMDYGSLYGMGSYYGEDYTASNPWCEPRFGTDTEQQHRFGQFR